ncbi:vomeronasal type-2 receptor 116-like, partial [Sigmodon hispidus]
MLPLSSTPSCKPQPLNSLESETPWTGTLEPIPSRGTLDSALMEGSSECYVKIKEDFHYEGDVMIGAFFPIHIFYTINKLADENLPHHFKDFHLQYNFRNYEFFLALVFAIEEINRNQHLLSNTSLGFDFYNLPYSDKQILMNVATWLTGLSYPLSNYNCIKENKAAAVLTGTSWTTSAHIGTFLQLYKLPQLTFGPFHPILSDQAQFSSVYQMAPKDTFLPLAIVSLMLHFHWTWVGLLLPDDHRGTQMLSDLREKMEGSSICLAFVQMIPGTWTSFSNIFWKNLGKIQESLANVIIIYGDSDSLQGVMRNLGQQFLTQKVWIINTQWDMTNHADYFMIDSFHGSLIFEHHHKEMVEFTNFIRTVNPYKYPDDNYLPKLWFLFFKCPLSELDCQLSDICQPNASLEFLPRHIFNMGMSEESYNIYKAVHAVAQSLHELSLELVQLQQNVHGKRMRFFPWQLHHFLRKINLKHNMALNWKQNSDAEYDIFNFWNFPKGLGLKVKVGTFSPNTLQHQQLSLFEQIIQWPKTFSEIPHSVCSESCGPGFRKAALQGKAVCCYECTSCPDNEISNETDVNQCVKCLENYFANKEKNHCLQKAVSFLAYDEPLGMIFTSIALCFSALTAVILGVFIKHKDTPIVKANNRALSYTLLLTLITSFLCPLLFIGHPNNITCILQQTTVGGAFTVALATVLAKAITVVIAFRVTFPGRVVRWLIVSRAPNFIIPVRFLIQLVLYGIWLGISPPFIDKDAHSDYGHIIIVCNMGSGIAFHCVLGYLCSLALGSYIMAFLSRNLPDTFNEAKFLSFSMLVFFCVWITFLPVYHSTKGKVMVAMEIFTILASSAALLGFIFVPKCYIIFFLPDKNSIAFAMIKGPFRTMRTPQKGDEEKNMEVGLCECYIQPREDFHHEGDVVISAFFPIHIVYTKNKIAHENLPHFFNDFYLQYNFRNYEFLLALVFAIEEINRNPHLLSNISLGFDFYNLPYNDIQILMNVATWLTGLSYPLSNYNCIKENKAAAVLTGTSWTTSAHIGTFLQLYKFPQLTFGPFDPILSDQAQFSSVYQMAPKDTFLSLAIVSLLLHFHWTWVGLLLPDDHRGTQMLSDLREKMESSSICLAFVEMIPATWISFSNKFWKNLGKIQESLANVIIIYGDSDSLQGIMRNLGQQFLTQKVWVINTNWDMTNHADYFMIDSFHGSLIFEHHHKEMFDFTNFVRTVNPYKYPDDNYLPKLWFLFFKCPLSELDCQLLEICQPNASLEFLPRHIFNMAMSEESYNIYKAVHAVAHSLHELNLEQVQLQQNINGKTMSFFPWQLCVYLHHFLRKINLEHNMALDWKKNSDAEYDIFNFWNFPKGLGLKVKVGTFSPNTLQQQQLSLYEQMMKWPKAFSEIPHSVCSESCGPGFRKAALEGKAVCCYDCTPCPDNEISNAT